MPIINPPKSVLLVCLGNICRSPSAEAVLRQKASAQGLDVVFDSAGTANYHTGSPPDKRAIQVGQKLGYELSHLRARQVALDDFYRFDVIFAMDKNNLQDLQKLQKTAATQQPTAPLATLSLFDNFDDKAVADPYYGKLSDFEQMYHHLQSVADRLIYAWTKEPNT